MDKQKTSSLHNGEKVVVIIVYAIVLVGLFFAIAGLSEFHNLKMAGRASGYAFGPIADNQWYYQNASIYSAYNLVSGLLFLSAFLTAIWGTIKRSKRILLAGVAFTVILLIATFVSSGIQ